MEKIDTLIGAKAAMRMHLAKLLQTNQITREAAMSLMMILDKESSPVLQPVSDRDESGEVRTA